MIRNKHLLLIGTIMILVQIVWTPKLWSIIELGGHHWWLIRLPLVVSMPVGIGLFLYAIKDQDSRGRSFSKEN